MSMGLNIGIKVKEQDDTYGGEGSNPEGTIEEVEKRFYDFLNERFPKGGFGGGWVHYNTSTHVYDFDVRMFRYSLEFEDKGYELKDMWLAITEFIYGEFSHLEGIEMRTYWSG